MPPFVREYKDLNLSFIPHPVTHDVVKITGSDAVRRSVRNLVLTDHYERPFQPAIGSGVAQLIFEPFTPFTEHRIKTAIEDVIRSYERRANLLNVVVSSDPDNNGFEAEITFEVINLIEPVTITVFLERVR